MGQELIVCDTNVIVEWLKGNLHTKEHLEIIGSENILLPSVSIMEVIQKKDFKFINGLVLY